MDMKPKRCGCKTTEQIMIKDGVTVSRCTYGCGRLIAEMTTPAGISHELKELPAGISYELEELPAWLDGKAGRLKCNCDLCETRRAAEAEAERLAGEVATAEEAGHD
jgi:hypothetical protein